MNTNLDQKKKIRDSRMKQKYRHVLTQSNLASESILRRKRDWKINSPSGSLMDIIRTHSQEELFCHPRSWTEHHLELLRVSIKGGTFLPPSRLHSKRRTSSEIDTMTDSILNESMSSGLSPHKAVYTIKTPAHPDHNEEPTYMTSPNKDHAIRTQVAQSVRSLQTLNGKNLFSISSYADKLDTRHIPLYFDRTLVCWLRPAYLIRDRALETKPSNHSPKTQLPAPLLAFNSDTDRLEMFDDAHCGPSSKRWTLESRNRRVFPPKLARIRSKLNSTSASKIVPSDIAMMLAMAQEADNIPSNVSSTPEKNQQPRIFKPILLTPSPDHTSLYIYRATISSTYLKSFADAHKPLVGNFDIEMLEVPYIHGDRKGLEGLMCELLGI